MNKISIVIGIGANELEIPLLVFPDTSAAKNYLKNLGLDASSGSCELPEEKMETSVYNKKTKDYDEIDNPLIKGLFKNGYYYDGCGGCYALEIREVEFGQPLIGWDLD